MRQCQRMFHNFGLSLIRPQTFPSREKEGLEEERIALKKLNVLEEDSTAVIVYQDEVHFQVTTSVTKK